MATSPYSLDLLRFQQTPASAERFVHWALLYVTETPKRKVERLCHVKKKEGITKYESWTYDSTTHLDKQPIGQITLDFLAFEEICMDVAEQFKFGIDGHNCQNWCQEVLKQVDDKLMLPIVPSSELGRGCLFLLKLSSSSSDSLNPTKATKS
jgi:hypothetical protein